MAPNVASTGASAPAAGLPAAPPAAATPPAAAPSAGAPPAAAPPAAAATDTEAISAATRPSVAPVFSLMRAFTSAASASGSIDTAGQPRFMPASRSAASACFVGLVLQRRQASERTRMRAAPRFDTSSILSTVYTLPARLQDLLHLVGGERVQAAAERCSAARGPGRAARSPPSPPRTGACGTSTGPPGGWAAPACPRCAMESSVSTAKSEAGQQLGNGVVDLRVVVVGAAGQHDAVRARGLHPGERLRRPAARMSRLNASSSAHAASTAASTSACVGAGPPAPMSSGCASTSSTNRRFFRCSFWSYGSPRRAAAARRTCAARRRSGAAPRGSWPRWGS